MKEIDIKGRKFNIKSLKYLDVVELSSIENRREHAIKILELSGLTKQQIEELTTEEGTLLMREINEINGFVDFQKTSQESKS